MSNKLRFGVERNSSAIAKVSAGMLLVLSFGDCCMIFNGFAVLLWDF